MEVAVSGAEVTLTGTVSDRYAKRRAEDLADDISGVKNVQNSIRVQQTPLSTSLSASSTAATGFGSKG